MSSKTLLSAPLRTDYPSLGQRIVFRLKVTGLQLRRAWQNRCHQSIHRHPQALTLIDYPILATSKTPLWTSEAAQESRWIAGKIQNLRVALQDLNGIEIPKSGIFSFWAQIGQPTRRNGYVEGRELRQGCLIPSVGGGLCQLSNALYSIALETGFEILERHAHSQVIPGSLAEVGRDATVFWNYVDLRFRVPENTRIEAYLSATDLVVQVRSSQTPHPSPTSSSTKDAQVRSWVDATHHCDACNVSGCSRSTPQLRTKRMLRTAYLVDEYWPEFDHYIQAHRQDQDWLMLPLPGKNWKKANYAWNTQGFATVKSATWQTLQRSLASRHLPVQGKSRQEQLLRNTQRLAEQYVAWAEYDITHVVVMQHLLPFLWQTGVLAGRTFDVLMTRLSLSTLQKRLDVLAQRYPQSPTLADFRADQRLLELEHQALRAARQLITPHSEIAQQYPDKIVRLNWSLPQTQGLVISGNIILFPAPTLGRKGAYELRDVLKTLNLSVSILGAELEGDCFWEGLSVQKFQGNLFQKVGVVVLPAHIEHHPRLLLRAIAQGIPVIASAACGLQGVAEVITIPTGDISALGQALAELTQTRAS